MQELDFEIPITELQAKINELRLLGKDKDPTITREVQKLETQLKVVTESIFSSLNAWQTTQLARHAQRPYLTDFIDKIFTDFEELQGDRHQTDDKSILTGLARLEGKPVVIIGHRKGRSTKDKVACNFGMPKPQGYRKALRIMELSERFHLPLLTFIDTPGAFPGVEAERNGQSEAIARNLLVMSKLKTPIISTVLGEGGSGGALAIGVADTVLMLQYSIYSVISPEGCASILWKSAEKAEEAAETMGLTSQKLLALGLIDGIIPEPLGGAHRNLDKMASTLKAHLINNLKQVETLPIPQLVEKRFQKLMKFGIFKNQ